MIEGVSEEVGDDHDDEDDDNDDNDEADNEDEVENDMLSVIYRAKVGRVVLNNVEL